MMQCGLVVLLLAHAVRSGVVYVDGIHRSLPAYAPENQALLDLPDMEISDTVGVAADALEQNRVVAPHLARMVAMPYFSTYKVDLSDARCPLDDDTATCGNRQCAIEPLSSEDIDTNLFESQYLGRLRKDSVSTEAPAQVGDDGCTPESAPLLASLASAKDYCYPEDESLDADGVYVDLMDNVERYTGYEGHHAALMWSKVYDENCFGYFGEHPPTASERTTISSQLADVLTNPKRAEVPVVEDCVEQRLFYKLLSGMHASISTHLSYDYLNSTTKEWGPNLPMWLDRVGWHRDRLDNMFFDYVLISRAVSKLASNYERQLLFSASCQTVDADVRVALRRLGRLLRMSPLTAAIDEQELFTSDSEAYALKNEFRQRVKNVNALMSCVGCERCRLWGKIQTAGYGTALKILFELPSDPNEDPAAVADVLGSFRRSELVALINTFARISHSITATEEFRDQIEDMLVDRTTVAYQWRQGMKETKVALGFILRSYIDLPKNLLFMASYYWHCFWVKLTTGHDYLPQNIDFNAGFHDEL